MRGQGALLREEILAAAIRVVDKSETVNEVSLRSIAREAGISNMSVYAHFDSREDVLAAVAELSWGQVREDINEQVQRGTTPRGRLLLGCQAYVAFAQRFPLRYVLMVKVDEITPSARQTLETVTRGLLAAGGMDPESEPDADAQRMAAALSVALHGVAMLHRTDTPHLWMSDFSTCDILQSMVDAAILHLERTAGAPRS
ncbi:TetR/AcrR family transcriptional regulator [Mycobacterium sp. CBMA293]|nr:TetR/AcrR family transcriptional regulator [Mycolicibacterium sp. CBMA 360]MUL58147.1 TetR/AcrR family transcriptional regulator [Mycolicibacterium sp. CBMA 335]MUL73605.1 TetR/AcrR family transcriptional regulator [Mycolicibacterium sp. CBMA 311]MUL93030.1 TetR/AcrR family transcriptional regulator [Mycolicibacterium sp. CBMA 230]MUM07579.1 TetR family transcriptional regulator [Mycolicibacterium sp. CBMA 213]MUM09873.1 TetR/AcrR family transcriptional regulator [Mycolicibacterium sp. CBMA